LGRLWTRPGNRPVCCPTRSLTVRHPAPCDGTRPTVPGRVGLTALVVGVRRKDFRHFGGHSGVMLNESSHDTASGLDTQGQWCNIEEEILCFLRSVARKNGSLNGSPIGEGLILLLGSLPPKQSDTNLTTRGMQVEPPDKNDFVNAGFVDLGISEDFRRVRVCCGRHLGKVLRSVHE
jgi:hypothetical protein